MDMWKFGGKVKLSGQKQLGGQDDNLWTRAKQLFQHLGNSCWIGTVRHPGTYFFLFLV